MSQLNMKADEGSKTDSVTSDPDDEVTMLKTSVNCSLGCEDASSSQTDVINSPLLSYMYASLQTGTREQLKRVVLGHFDPKLISDAKKDLWKCYGDVLGKMKERKGSCTKPKYEFEVDDVLDAMNKLDTLKIEPNLVVSASDLFLLPRTRPEEVLPISIIERLSTLESQMKRIIEEYVVDPCRSEIFSTLREIAQDNVTLKRRVDSLEMPPPVLPQPVNPRPQHTQVLKNSQLLQQQQQKSQSSHQHLMQQQPNQESLPHSSLQQPQQPPDRQQPPYQQQTSKLPPAGPTAPTRRNDVHGSQGSLASWPSLASAQEFQLPAKQQRKMRRRAMRNRGTRSTADDTQLKGAPVPMRDLFVYRVMKPSSCDDVKRYIQSLNLNAEVGDIELLAHPEAKYNSFRVSCDVTNFKQLLKGENWPDGVCVDRFRRKKEEKQ